MSDATKIAREIQDAASAMAESMSEVADAMKAAVVVTMANARASDTGLIRLETQAPTIQLPPPNIDVQVNLPQQVPPAVNIQPANVSVNSPVNVVVPQAAAVAYEVEVTERDHSGMIKRFIIVPIEG